MQKMRIGLNLVGEQVGLDEEQFVEYLVKAVSLLPDKPFFYLIISADTLPNYNKYFPLLPYMEGTVYIGPKTEVTDKVLTSSYIHVKDLSALLGIVDIIFPQKNGSIPGFSISWIPDFQHIYNSNLFSIREIEQRNHHINHIAQNAESIYFHSESVEQEFRHLFPLSKAKSYTILNRVFSDQAWFAPDPEIIRNKYSINKDFIICCNQFWRHNNYEVLFHALGVVKEHGKIISLVCIANARDDQYMAVLSQLAVKYDIVDQIRIIIGSLPPIELVQLLRSSNFVVQPSAIGCFNSNMDLYRALGKDVLLSDLSMHRDYAYGIMFDPNNVQELATKITYLFDRTSSGPDRIKEKLARDNSDILIQQFAKKMNSMFYDAIHNFFESGTDSMRGAFINHNQVHWGDWACNDKDNIILIDFFEYPEAIIPFSYFSNVIAELFQARLVSFFSRRRAFDKRTSRIYDSFNVREHIVTRIESSQIVRKNELLQKIIYAAKTKQSLFDLHIMGVNIGIDIYQSYLRYCNKPTVDFDDPQLFYIFENAAELLIFWDDYFLQNKVKAVISCHDCYLKYNVVNKIAYKYKVPVYFIAPSQVILANQEFTRTMIIKNYPKIFSQLPLNVQQNSKAWAKNQLERRFSGEIGIGMAASEGTAFGPEDNNEPILRKNDKFKVLICSHCFFDDPHLHGGVLFPDFYEWLCFLGEISVQTNYDWYIKVHPNPLPGTLPVIREIIQRYPAINLLPVDAKHPKLVREGIGCVLTVYGTVGFEYPLMGVPVINAGNSPYMAYDFTYKPRSLSEYRDLLLNLDKLDLKVDFEQIYECYFMRIGLIESNYSYLFLTEFLKNVPRDLLPTSETYKCFLEQFDETQHKKIISKLRTFVLSGKTYSIECEISEAEIKNLAATNK